MAGSALAVVLSMLAVVLAPAVQADPPPTLRPTDLVVADSGNDRLVVVPADGSDAWVLVDGVTDPGDVAVSGDGRVYVVSSGAVLVYAATGGWLDTLTDVSDPRGVAVGQEGSLLVTGGGGDLSRYTVRGFEVLTTGLADPRGVDVDSDRSVRVMNRGVGLMFFDRDGHLAGTDVNVVDADWVASTARSYWFTDHDGDHVYGNGGDRTASIPGGIDAPNDIAALGNDLFVADGGHDRVVRYVDGSDSWQVVDTGPLSLENPTGLAAVPLLATPASYGDIYVADPENGRVLHYDIVGGRPSTVGTGLRSPQGVAVDGEGNVYIADQPSHLIDTADPPEGRLIKVSADGLTQTVLADDLYVPWGVAADDDHVYVSDFSDAGGVYRMDHDGGNRSTVDTGALFPAGLAVDPDGNLLVADPFTSTVRKVPADGSASFAIDAGVSFPWDVATDADSDVILAGGFGGPTVVVPGGVGTPAAVGPAHESPYAGAVTPVGDMLVADAGRGAVTRFELESGAALAPVGFGDFPTPGPDQDDYQGPYDVAVFAPAPTITSTDPDDGTFGQAYSFGYTTDDLVGKFRLEDGDLPDGLTLGTDGTLSGTPTAAGDFTFRVRVANRASRTISPETTITIAKAAQTIAFTSSAPSPAAIGGSYSPGATGGGSGNDVDFSISPASSGVCHLDAGVVRFDHAGDCVVLADQAGDDDHLAAGQESQTVTVAKRSQTIAFTSTPPGSAVVGDSYTPTATGGASGNPVTFTVDPTPAGACEISAGTVAFRHGGSCVIRAAQAGGPDDLAAGEVTQTVGIGRVAATVAFSSAPPAGAVAGGTYTPLVMTGPANPSYDLRADGGCTLTWGTVRFDRAGACVLTATVPTDGDRIGAQAVQTIVVAAAASATTLTIEPARLVAEVSAEDAAPTGTVTFTVDGVVAGSADLVDGTAELEHALPVGADHVVLAEYSGDGTVAASADSAERRDPGLAYSLTSRRAPYHGWYRRPVTVEWECTPETADLAGPCPAPVELTRQTRGRTVTRTISALDGGAATAAVTVRIDRTGPRLRVVGPELRCVARDRLSGVSSCVVETRQRGHHVRFTAVAEDRAGNRTVVRGRRPA